MQFRRIPVLSIKKSGAIQGDTVCAGISIAAQTIRGNVTVDMMVRSAMEASLWMIMTFVVTLLWCYCWRVHCFHWTGDSDRSKQRLASVIHSTYKRETRPFSLSKSLPSSYGLSSMDLSPMDQDNESFTSTDKWSDHVKWQGSQTACSALNQLIKSSVNETALEAPRTTGVWACSIVASNLYSVSFFVLGWQRASSYDQLSSFSSTSHHDTESSSLLSSHSRTSLSKPSSSSRPHSRARLSEAQTPSPDITTLDLPLFNKTNPMQFLDIMKGVSARLDENAGVRSRKELNLDGPSSSRAKKQNRGVSLGGSSELQSERATRGIVKKGRVDELPTSGTLTWDEGKGKGRATSENEGWDLEVRGRGLQTHSSLPDIPSRSDLKPSLSSKDMCSMDVDDKDDNTDEAHTSRSAVSSSSSNHDYLDTPFARTLSQTEMPPPPLPRDSLAHRHRQPATDPPRQQSNASSISTPLTASRHSNSIHKPQTSYPPPQQPRKPDAIPRLHPLLYRKPTTKVSSSSTLQAQVRLQHHPAPKPASEGIDLKPPPSSFTPLFSSTPSSRPPPLGMRRNHTFPSRTSSIVQQGSLALTGSGGQLPQRQKGFKPPLLSLSQPQAQAQGLSRVNSNTNVIIVESGSTITASKKVSSENLPESSSTDNRGFNPNPNSSMSSRSSTSSSSTPSITPSAPSPSRSHSSVHSQCAQGMAMQPQESVINPEPLDGDADSSFGEMSFDMDALEETMRMYDWSDRRFPLNLLYWIHT